MLPRRRSDRLRGVPSGFVTVIEPRKGWAAPRLGELWPYRELLYFLTWRDIKVRYKQAVLGVAWAILQPFLTMVVFTVVFNRAPGVKSPDRTCRTRSSASRPPALAVLRRGALAVRREPRRQRQPAHQGLLPPPGDPDLGRAGRACRLRHLVRRPARPDGRTTASPPPGTSSSCPLFVLLALATALAVGLWLQRSQRAVPRRAVHHPVPGAALDVRQPGHLPDQRHPRRAAAHRLRSQPDDRRHRRASAGRCSGSSCPATFIVDLDRGGHVVLLVGGLFYFKRMERIFADVV